MSYIMLSDKKPWLCGHGSEGIVKGCPMSNTPVDLPKSKKITARPLISLFVLQEKKTSSPIPSSGIKQVKIAFELMVSAISFK